MITAIFGASLTGKTTVSCYLSQALDQPMRSCGDEVRHCANLRGVPLDAVPDEVHRQVDAATLTWVCSQDAAIVEGRFLDAVLATLGRKSVFLVRLTCQQDQRLLRLPTGSSARELRVVDAQDAAFRARLRYDQGLLVPELVIDTSGTTIIACAQQIRTAMDVLRT